MVQQTAAQVDTYLTGAARVLSLVGAAVGLLLLFLLAVGVSVDTVIAGGYFMFAAAIGVLVARVGLVAVHSRQ